MSTKTLPRQNRTGRPTTESHVYIGTDETGTIHHYDGQEARIVAITDGAVEHIERFEDTDDPDAVVTEWIDFVEAGRGWDSLKYITAHQMFDNGLGAGFRRASELMEDSA